MSAEAVSTLQTADIRQSFSYVGALRGVNLTLTPGKIVALLGVNGAGKSTFLNTVLGLATSTQDDISVHGMSPCEAVHHSLASVIFQTRSMPRNGKTRNTIDLVAAMHVSPTLTDELLERINLTKFAKHPFDKFPRGERQRVYLTLTLVGNPEFLILDEPTVGMDALACRASQEVMRTKVAEGRAPLLTMHYSTEARKDVDRIVIIDAGKALLNILIEQIVIDNEDLEDTLGRITSHTDVE